MEKKTANTSKIETLDEIVKKELSVLRAKLVRYEIKDCHVPTNWLIADWS